MEKKEPSYTGLECKLVQPLWKTVWRFLKKLKIEIPYDAAISILDLYPEKNENSSSKDTCTSMFISEWMKVSQSYPTICNPIDYSQPGSSVRGIPQAKYWSGLPLPSPADLPDPAIWISCIAGWFFTIWATEEALSMFGAALFTIVKTWK